MTDAVRPPETAPSPAGGRVALLAFAVGALAVGWALDTLGPVAVVVAGGLPFWFALRWYVDPPAGVEATREPNRARPSDTPDAPDGRTVDRVVGRAVVHGGAVGVGLSATIGGVAWAAALGPRATLVTGLVAVAVLAVVGSAATGLERAVGLAGPAATGVLGTLVVGLGLLVVAWGTVGSLAVTVVWMARGAPPRPLVVLLVAQLFGLAIALFLPAVERAVRGLVGPDRYRSPAAVRWLARSPRDVPRWYLLALAGQAGLAVWVRLPTVPFLPSDLASAGAFAGKLLPVVGSLVLAGMAGIVGVWLLSRAVAVRGTTGPAGVRILTASAVAGLAGVGAVRVVGRLPPWETAIAGLLGASCGIAAVVLVWRGFDSLVGWRLLPTTGVGFAVGSGTLVGMAVAVVVTGGSPLVVYLAVSSALVVWYVGRRADDLGRTLGRAAETAEGEATHAVAVIGVVGLAAAVVSLVTYTVGIPRLVAPDRAVGVAFFLALAALALLTREAVRN